LPTAAFTLDIDLIPSGVEVLGMSRAFELLVRLRSNSERRSAWLRIARAPGFENLSSNPTRSKSKDVQPKAKLIHPITTAGNTNTLRSNVVHRLI
jgi:hypothetical protein